MGPFCRLRWGGYKVRYDWRIIPGLGSVVDTSPPFISAMTIFGHEWKGSHNPTGCLGTVQRSTTETSLLGAHPPVVGGMGGLIPLKSYCWWLKSCDHQLRLVVYPRYLRPVLAPSQGYLQGFEVILVRSGFSQLPWSSQGDFFIFFWNFSLQLKLGIHMCDRVDQLPLSSI